MPTLARITWGQNYCNTLTFAYPLESPKAWSGPRQGSTRDRSDAGVEAMWIIGKDYYLRGAFRWLVEAGTTSPAASAYDSPTGLRAMLDWAHRENQIRFHPDASNPANYITCDVVEPWDEEPALEADATYVVPLLLRTTERSFASAIRGVLFEYKGGMLAEDFGATFVRGSTATYCGADGFIKTAALHELRHEWADLDNNALVDTVGTLIEGTSTQRVRRSTDLSHADWNKTNVDISIGALDPTGAYTGQKIAENTTTSGNHSINQALQTITSGARQTISVWFKPLERTQCAIRLGGASHSFTLLFDSGALTISGSTVGTGAVTTGSTGYRKYKNGWFRFWGTGTCGTDTSVGITVFLASGGLLSYAGTVNSGALFWNPQWETGEMITSSITNATSSDATRSADQMTFVSRLPVATMTIYLKVSRLQLYDYVGTVGGPPLPFCLGAVGPPNSRIEIDGTAVASRVVSVSIIDPSTGGGTATAAIPAGSSIEIAAQLDVAAEPSPVAKIRLDVGSGYGSYGGTSSVFPAWVPATIGLGSLTGTSNFYNGVIFEVKIAIGNMSMAQMRTL